MGRGVGSWEFGGSAARSGLMGVWGLGGSAARRLGGSAARRLGGSGISAEFSARRARGNEGERGHLGSSAATTPHQPVPVGLAAASDESSVASADRHAAPCSDASATIRRGVGDVLQHVLLRFNLPRNGRRAAASPSSCRRRRQARPSARPPRASALHSGPSRARSANSRRTTGASWSGAPAAAGQGRRSVQRASKSRWRTRDSLSFSEN